ncbi:MAG: 1-phosphofructokinase [Clostridiales bacterium]|nr:1-phosphofructokinase [Clostridiales bacterium]
MILTVTLNAAIDKRYVVDGFRQGEVNRVRECVYTPGGKGLNVSKSAAIAGAEVTATGLIGGHAGEYIEEALKKLGIRCSFLKLEEESRSCVNIWDESRKMQTEFLEPGFAVKEEQFERFASKYQELAKEAQVVSISGSVPRGLDGLSYQRLVKIAKDLGKKVILDTSGALLEMGIKAAPSLVKPNLDEIRALSGRNCETLEDIVLSAKEIHLRGVEMVVVSLGADGAVAVCGEGAFRAKVPKVSAVNTVGCGDSMIAGFAIGFAQGLSPKKSLRKASAMSAASALSEETGFFRIEDMERLLNEVEVERL